MSLAYIQPILLTPAAAGGTVKLFLAGSTDQAPTYSPVTGEVSYSPLSIDSAGYCAAFTVDSTNTYDLKVYKANGSLYLTRENVTVLGGSAGAAGPQGPRGIRGEKGDKGDTGASGQDGTDGTNGTNGTDGADGVSLVSVRINETTGTGRVEYNKSDDPNTWIVAGDLMPDGIGQVKLYAEDSLGYMEDKLEAGPGISIGHPNSNSILTIENTAPETYKTQASQYSTVKDFLNTLIVGTNGITVTTSADFNTIVLNGAGIGGSGFEPKGEWASGTTYTEGEGVWYYDPGQTPVINRYYVATTTTTSNPYTDGTGWVIMFSIDQLGDQMVRLDSADPQTGFWLDKVKAGQGITFTRTVDAGGDYITVSGQPTFSVTTTNGSYTIDGLGNEIKFRDGMWTNPIYIGTEIAIEHKSIAQMQGQTTPIFTATGLPKFDDYGHYMNASDPIEIGDVAGLADAILAAGDGKIKVDATDAKGYAVDKIVAGDNVTINQITNESGKALEVNATVPNINRINSNFTVIKNSANGDQTISSWDSKSLVGWTESNGKLVTTEAGLMNIGIYAEVLHDAEINTASCFYATPLIAEFATTTDEPVLFDVRGYYGTDRISFIDDGGWQVNYSITATAGTYIKLHLRQYDASDWLLHDIILEGTAPTTSNETFYGSRVLSTETGGYLKAEITVGGAGLAENISITGFIPGAEHDIADPSIGLQVWHCDSNGSLIKAYHVKDMWNAYKGLTAIAFAQNINMNAGQYFVVHVNGTMWGSLQNISMTGAITQAISEKGDKGDPGSTTLDGLTDVDVSSAAAGQVLGYNGSLWVPVTGGGGSSDPTLDGAQSYALIMTNGSISTGHTSDQGSTYASARIITAAEVESNFISCFATQVSTFYGLRMGIFTPGAAGDTLIAQTANLTTTPSSGIITLPLLYDANGNLLTTPLKLHPNQSYLLSAVIKGNGCQFASYTGISTNPPNHFGRKDDWNAPAPTNLMQQTVGYTQSSQFIWMSVSK